jgi:hypothetical protein
VDAAEVYDNRLYRGLDELIPLHEELFGHLRERYRSLFGSRFEFLLYDVTSAYFEGQAKCNPQAQRGYSRDSRPGCKQVCIGLAVTPEGLPLAYEVFDGNRSDVTTVKDIVGPPKGRLRHFERELLEQRDRRRRNPIELDASLRKRPQKLESAGRRIGRWLGRNTAAEKVFKVAVIAQSEWAAGLQIEEDPGKLDWAATSQGAYLLRTNCTEHDPVRLWRWYVRLTGIEDAFRVGKSDVELRPRVSSAGRSRAGPHSGVLPGPGDVAVF